MGTNTSKSEGTTPPETTPTSDASCPENKSEYISAEFWLMAVFGGTVCLIGFAFNIALLQVLFQRKLRTTYLIYLAALAIMDIGILITYVLLMVVDNLYQYLQSYTLFLIWHAYVKYLYTLSRIVTLASTYLVLVCTLERYWEVINLKSQRHINMTQTKRYVIVACVILASIAFRAVVFLEVTIDVSPECRGTMGYLTLNQTELVQDYVYSKIYSFWAVHVAQVFFPFPALIFLNVAITATWRHILSTNRRDSNELRKFAKKSQSARQMMVAIVTSYLVCNALHFVLTVWEHVDMDYLRRHGEFYAFASDAVTLLTAINASFRLPIYYASNVTIRAAIRNLWFAKSVEYVYSYTRSRASRRKRTGNTAQHGRQEEEQQHETEDDHYLLSNGFNGTDPKHPDDLEKDPEIKPLREFLFRK